MRKNELHFYRLLRDFLSDYLTEKRNFSDKTARAYRQTFKMLRKYLREEKGISFDRMDFSCFSRSGVYDFLMWLKETRKNSTQTLNLRLSAIKSFLKYCSEEDMSLTPLYLDVVSIHAFKGAKRSSNRATACMALLKLSDKHTPERLESACAKALRYTPRPSYKSIQTILKSGIDKVDEPKPDAPSGFGFTRGAGYYKKGDGK